MLRLVLLKIHYYIVQKYQPFMKASLIGVNKYLEQINDEKEIIMLSVHIIQNDNNLCWSFQENLKKCINHVPV